MPKQQWDGRVLSLYAAAHGLAFAVFEAPQSVIDWGCKSLKGQQKNPRGLQIVTALIEQYQPDVIVLEDCTAPGSRRSLRVRRFYHAVAALARSETIEVHRYSRQQLRACFGEAFGATTKPEIAHAIATRLPVLAHRLPPPRKKWQPEDPRMSIFDAVALGFAFFRFDAAGSG